MLPGLVFTTFPLVIRYGRMGVLDPMLMLVTTMGGLWLWEWLSFAGKKGPKQKLVFYSLSVLIGVAYGLSISTKLTGIFFAVFIAVVITLVVKKNDKQGLVFGLLLAGGGFLVTFILLNDPYSYYFGWMNFSDPKAENISPLTVIKSLTALAYWSKFVPTLIGILPFLLLIAAALRYRTKLISKRAIFIMAWILTPLSYLIINPSHVTGLSSEWAYMPLMPPLALVVGKMIVDISDKYLRRQLHYGFGLALNLYFLTMLPIIAWYGWRLKPLPLPNLTRRNVVWRDLAMTRIINTLNAGQTESIVLIELKGVILPLWMLDDHIRTEPRYHDLDFYDYIVTDNEGLVSEAVTQGFKILKREKNASEPEVVLLSG